MAGLISLDAFKLSVFAFQAGCAMVEACRRLRNQSSHLTSFHLGIDKLESMTAI